jgi:hypothetical protein
LALDRDTSSRRGIEIAQRRAGAKERCTEKGYGTTQDAPGLVG